MEAGGQPSKEDIGLAAVLWAMEQRGRIELAILGEYVDTDERETDASLESYIKRFMDVNHCPRWLSRELSAIRAAFLHPDSISPEIEGVCLETLPSGVLATTVGSTSVVMLGLLNGKEIALRVPFSDSIDIGVRAGKFSRYVGPMNLPSLTPGKFIEKGILINGEWLPVLVMDRAKGTRLYDIIENRNFVPEHLRQIAARIAESVLVMQEAGVAHGDICPANMAVLVEEGSLSLSFYDYGRCYTEELAHDEPPQPATEIMGDRFSPLMDTLPAATLYTALLALALWPELAREPVEHGIIFTAKDLKDPERSPLIVGLANCGDPEVSSHAIALAHLWQSYDQGERTFREFLGFAQHLTGNAT